MWVTRRGAMSAVLSAVAVRPALGASSKVSYLLPAPAVLPAFIPFHVARKRDYFVASGIDVSTQTTLGAVEVGKQVALGNSELGSGLGDTPIIVRPNGPAIRGVAMLGQHALHQLVCRQASGIASVSDLRGKKVGVLSFQDTGYYALLAVMAANKIRKEDVEIQSLGPAGITQLMIAKSADAIVGVIEWADAIESAGLAINRIRIENYFPAMPQAILASDTIIRERPELVGGFVRAMMRALRDCIDDPISAVKDYIAIVPQQADKSVEIERILKRYIAEVFRTDPPSKLGQFDPERLKQVQSFYLEARVIRSTVPVDELYTNDFVT